MKLIHWNDRLNLGIEKIDEQHKKLVMHTNSLHTAIHEARSNERIASLCEELLAYVNYHFSTEEELFARYNFPKTDEHIQEHQYFTLKVIEFANRIRMKPNGLDLEFLAFLYNWIRNHIQISDREYAEFFHQIDKEE